MLGIGGYPALMIGGTKCTNDHIEVFTVMAGKNTADLEFIFVVAAKEQTNGHRLRNAFAAGQHIGTYKKLRKSDTHSVLVLVPETQEECDRVKVPDEFPRAAEGREGTVFHPIDETQLLDLFRGIVKGRANMSIQPDTPR